MNSASVIRPAETEDIPAMTELLRQLFSLEKDFDIDRDKQIQGLRKILIEPGADCLLAVENNRILGMCTMQRLVSTARGTFTGLIEDMVINEEDRGMGVGRKLLKAMEEIAWARKYTRIQLAADRNNSAALAFYNKVKWQRTDLIILRKTEL